MPVVKKYFLTLTQPNRVIISSSPPAAGTKKGFGCQEDTIYDKPEHRPIPLVGQRIVKTSIAVFFCLMIYYLRGYSGNDMPTEAMITAIICMQPYVRDSGEFALNRLAGTMIGAFWGLMFLLMLLIFPQMGRSMPLIYARMALGVLISLYTAVLIGKPDTASLAAIVFLCIVIAFPEIEQPLQQAGERILGVFIGTFVAIGVNIFRLPRDKQRDLVFFLRTKDLVPDRFSQIPAAAMFRLNYLYADGAKICLMSEHAPAFFVMQMQHTKLNVPLIVMDGAALYDAEQNVFGQLPLGVNHASFAFLQAPIPVRFMFCRGDMFPFAGSLVTWNVVSNTAERCGLAGRYAMTDADGEHGWKESTRVSSVERAPESRDPAAGGRAGDQRALHLRAHGDDGAGREAADADPARRGREPLPCRDSPAAADQAGPGRNAGAEDPCEDI